MADPVYRVGCCVGPDVVAGGFHDEADDYQKEHEEEAFNTAPDVDQLGDKEVADSTGYR